MNAQDRRAAVRRLLLMAWGLVTLTLLFCVGVLAIEMSRKAPETTAKPAETTGQVAEAPTAGTPASTPVSPEGGMIGLLGQSHEVDLFFADGEERLLVGEKSRISLGGSTEENCRRALEALIKGSQNVLSPILPPSTKVRGVYLLPGGELVVDLSIDVETELKKLRSASVESLMVYGVVNTLTQPALKEGKDEVITSVRFLIEGAPPRESFPAHVDLSLPVVADPSWIAATNQG